MTQLVESKTGDEGLLVETHLGHCVVSLNKTLYPLFSTGLTQ